MSSIIKHNPDSEYSESDGWTPVVRKRCDAPSRSSQTTTNLPSKPPFIKKETQGTFIKKETHAFTKGAELKKPDVFVNLKIVKLNLNNAAVHPKVYNYIRSLILAHSEPDVIRITKSIGLSPNDKTICLTNLFFICVRQDKTALMQRIIDFVTENERLYMVNAYDRKYTPIMQAAYNGSANSVKLLLNWGADVNIINVDGEDAFSATSAGCVNQVKEHPSLEIFLKPKYQEILNYLQWWRDNKHEKDITVDETVNTSFETEKIINVKLDIVSQIESCLESYIEDSRTKQMKQLFEEINSMVSEKIIDKQHISKIFDKFKEILETDYVEEYETLVCL